MVRTKKAIVKKPRRLQLLAIGEDSVRAKANKERERKAKLDRLSATVEHRNESKKALNQVYGAMEKALCVAKDNYEKSEAEWALTCIELGKCMKEGKVDWEDERDRFGEDWDFVCFLEARGETDAMTSDGKINDSSNGWCEWKGVALREGWLSEKQALVLENEKEEEERENSMIFVGFNG